MSGYIVSQCSRCGRIFDDGYRNYSVPKHTCISKEEIDAIIQDMQKYTEFLKNNPEKAKQFLINAGIYTKSGKLSKNFGG